MKNCFYVFVLLLIACGPASAQTPVNAVVPALPRHELGVQANQLLRQIASFGNSSVPFSNPFILSYKAVSKKGKSVFRSGFGYTFNTINVSNSSLNTNSVLNSFDLRLGQEWRRNFTNRILFFYGYDVLFGFASNKTKASSFTSITTNSNFGFGPLIGIDYYFTKRLKIGTEANYYLTINTQRIRSGLVSGSQTAINALFTLSPPAVLYLSFIFNQRPAVVIDKSLKP
jgi:opacity protein-like surface antigen